MSGPVPVIHLPGDHPLRDRMQKLNDFFTSNFSTTPEFFVRCPGRVNLIGEHIDYCGYSVLPMAIQQDIVLAVARNDSGKLGFVNTDSRYPDYEGDIGDVSVDKSNPAWFNYVLSGFLGVRENCGLGLVKGLFIAADGCVPPSAGLSSSSSLVCASVLSFLHANDLTLTKEEVAALSAKSEKFVGTEGGGMDQAISILAEPDKAKLIDFDPVRATDVNLPEGATFVIANSLSELNKAATSDYNTRVVECRLAAQVIAKHHNLEWQKLRRLDSLPNALKVELSKMADLVKEALHEESYSKSEICLILGLTEPELNEISLNQNTLNVQSFKLRQRALHVYGEAQRVYDFKLVCDRGDTNALQELGELMNASHASCKDLYECSHECLDELVEISREAGALGSRLTGAGWGGCTVSLVPSDEVDSYMGKVKQAFYSKDPERSKRVTSALFPTKPGGGAVIYLP